MNDEPLPHRIGGILSPTNSCVKSICIDLCSLLALAHTTDYCTMYAYVWLFEAKESISSFFLLLLLLPTISGRETTQCKRSMAVTWKSMMVISEINTKSGTMEQPVKRENLIWLVFRMQNKTFKSNLQSN